MTEQTPYIGDEILVDVEYIDGHKRTIELVIVADRVLDGHGNWYPGVEALDTSDFDAETIAYGINEGFYADWLADGSEDEPMRQWRVREPGYSKLRELGIVNRHG